MTPAGRAAASWGGGHLFGMANIPHLDFSLDVQDLGWDGQYSPSW
jgi:hypothetical protein